MASTVTLARIGWRNGPIWLTLARMGRLTLICLLVLALPALALAAKEGKYKGKVVDDSGKVTFKVDGNKVKKFAIDGVYANCYGGGMLVSVYVPSAKIKGDNTFRKRYVPDPDSDFHVILKGRFDGQKASGKVTGEGVCGYEEKWKANLR
jgi:hypothetical protein